MNQEQRQAYEWANSQNYQSVAARYAKVLAGLVDEMAPPNEPLTLEQLRQMDGKPAYWPEDESWGIIAVDSVGKWAGIPFFRGRWHGVNFEYDIEARGMEVYAYPPAHIDLEVWTAEWENHYRSGVHAGTGAVCSSCDVWNGRKTHFCPFCGKAMTPEARAMLEKRLRG